MEVVKFLPYLQVLELLGLLALSFSPRMHSLGRIPGFQKIIIPVLRL